MTTNIRCKCPSLLEFPYSTNSNVETSSHLEDIVIAKQKRTMTTMHTVWIIHKSANL